MKTLNNILSITGLALLAAVAAPAQRIVIPQQDRFFGDGISAVCQANADSYAAQLRRQGVAEAVVESRYQTALAICSGTDPLVAGLVAGANVEYARLARLAVDGQISPGLYLALIQSTNRKLYLARHDPNWVVEYAKGDADGDLVPDSMDRCPNTPDLTPTDDNGCPSTAPLPPAPDEHEISMIKDGLGLVTSKACDGAPDPNTSRVNKAGFDNESFKFVIGQPNQPGSFAFSVLPVTNQPQGCPVFYEIEVRLFNPLVTGPDNQLFNLVFRDTENADLQNRSDRRVFRAQGTAQGQFVALFLTELETPYQSLEIRVRTMNGNGLTMGWGPSLRIEGDPLFGEN